MKPLFHGLVAVIALLGVIALAHSGDADGEEPLLRDVTDLRAEAGRGMPILVEFALAGCPYCRVAEEDFLKPMIRSGDYEDKVLIRRLRMDRSGSLVDFDGREISARDLAARYGVRIAPTVVVLGPDGQVLSDPVVGLKTVDFYGGYLDRAIRQAVQSMTGPARDGVAALR